MPYALNRDKRKPLAAKWSRIKAGDKLGRLTAVRYEKTNAGGSAYWLFACDCGNTKIARVSHVKAGMVRSCGCLTKERVTTHGMSKTPVYNIWIGMKDRCYDPSNKSYADYGGRGITVCERWRESFEAFYADMGDRPTPRHSIDRINNDGDYEPGNCRWATKEEQIRNRPYTRKFVVNGSIKTLQDLAQEYGFTSHLLYDRVVMHNWPVERALSTPVRILTRRAA